MKTIVKIRCKELNKAYELSCNAVTFQENTYATFFPKFFNGVTIALSKTESEKIINDLSVLFEQDVIVKMQDFKVKMLYKAFKCMFDNTHLYIFGEESEWI